MRIFRSFICTGPTGVQYMILILPEVGLSGIKGLNWEVQTWVWSDDIPYYSYNCTKYGRTFEKALVAAEETMFKLKKGIMYPELPRMVTSQWPARYQRRTK